ncbi:MAG: glycogen debranching protein GlgX [Desulfobulbaceae bacterium]|nr:glycogen debranching protein GlgX [Desulfobulbaceae bacterium]
MELWPGKPYPLGATADASGTNFSIFSECAESVELCLFDDQGNESRLELPETNGYCRHGYLPDCRPGQKYGFRVHGPWQPEEGHRCNPAKLLLDPYAKAIDAQVNWDASIFSFDHDAPEDSFNDQDSASFVPRSVVITNEFDWQDDRLLKIPLHETIIYETHVKGFTAQHPDIPEELRGTYAGLAHPAAIEHLTRLGITAVELMPAHQFVHDGYLLERKLKNYWGYNTIGYFTPHNEYSSSGMDGSQVREFKQMVRSLHAAGIEVILDVVYNHTAEGNHLGPTLCFKGIDNSAYYRLVDDDKKYYMDFTGTGNSLNMQNAHVLQMIMDSLRYWVTEMHVDGFRFDLASTLARELHEVNKLAVFFQIIQQDPVISQVKLIAEPWDVGEGGYQVGNFPPLWSEWNGKYRDCLRDFWRGKEQVLKHFAARFTGSSDLYENTGRLPFASINFITAHDGFTLRDLVSYNDKHNEANSEENRDGDDNNRSWNCGHEGPTDDEQIEDLRHRQVRNFLTSLFLSQGVPMLLGGDEAGRTQQGNNNAYCQDNEISWFNWQDTDDALMDFTAKLIDFRRNHPVFMRRGWFQGRSIRGSDLGDIAWFNTQGDEMNDEDWDSGLTKAIMIFLNGKAILCRGSHGEKIKDQSFCLLYNTNNEAVQFQMPDSNWGERWKLILSTADGGFVDADAYFDSRQEISVAEFSMSLLQLTE